MFLNAWVIGCTGLGGQMIMHSEFGRNQLWAFLKYYSTIFLESLGKSQQTSMKVASLQTENQTQNP
jgi:hypothetical protein